MRDDPLSKVKFRFRAGSVQHSREPHLSAPGDHTVATRAIFVLQDEEASRIEDGVTDVVVLEASNQFIASVL